MNILDFAMEFESKSREYYQQLANEVEIKELKDLFNSLAEDELRHIEVIRDMKEGSKVEFASKHLGEANDAFYELLGKEVTPQYLTKLIALDKALAFEDESMAFYKEKSESAATATERLVFFRLYFEEKKHYEVLNRLIEYTTYLETSLETAEFQN
ncbi:MAG: hypothetical protein AVO33_07085 [delta proteobacterium ML8_F1]|nr:MAG: hypothetical protein AVO33_07085 [delta proteobacterium ML8_F1]